MFRTMCGGDRDGPSPAAHCRFADTGTSPDGAHLPEMHFLLPPQQVQRRSGPPRPLFSATCPRKQADVPAAVFPPYPRSKESRRYLAGEGDTVSSPVLYLQ